MIKHYRLAVTTPTQLDTFNYKGIAINRKNIDRKLLNKLQFIVEAIFSQAKQEDYLSQKYAVYIQPSGFYKNGETIIKSTTNLLDYAPMNITVSVQMLININIII
jgi:hypothetical protein